MVYCGTSNTETIWFGSENNSEEVDFIDLYRVDNELVFYVDTCCNDSWGWAFKMDVPSNYEIVKFTIMSVALGCQCMNDLLNSLDEIFSSEEFADMILKNECEYDIRLL